MISIELKKSLHKHALELLNKKIEVLHHAMAETNESMQTDTKSSAGDKYETGREMMQIELNNLKSQFNQIEQSKTDLQQVNLTTPHTEIGFGSLVSTNLGIYFVSIGLGQVKYLNQNYFFISLASPIGKVLKGCKNGETVSFNGQTLSLNEII